MMAQVQVWMSPMVDRLLEITCCGVLSLITSNPNKQLHFFSLSPVGFRSACSSCSSFSTSMRVEGQTLTSTSTFLMKSVGGISTKGDSFLESLVLSGSFVDRSMNLRPLIITEQPLGHCWSPLKVDPAYALMHLITTLSNTDTCDRLTSHLRILSFGMIIFSPTTSLTSANGSTCLRTHSKHLVACLLTSNKHS